MMILDSGYIFGPPCIVAPISAFNFASDSAYTHTHTLLYTNVSQAAKLMNIVLIKVIECI